MPLPLSPPLRISAEGPIVVSALDVLAFIGEHMDFLVATAGPDLKIVINEYGHSFKVLAETNILRLALCEILINARTAMPNGGDVTFTILPIVVKEDIFLLDGDYMRMSISENGIGFSLSTLTNVLRKPEAGQRAGGLGRFAEDITNWGGAIRVKLRRSRGATVHLYLRRATIH